jgi:hypothetical protein
MGSPRAMCDNGGPPYTFPARCSHRSGTALENCTSGQVKFGPLVRRSRVAHRMSAPRPKDTLPHVVCRPIREATAYAFMMTCHWSIERCRVSRTPFAFSNRVRTRGVKIDGTHMQWPRWTVQNRPLIDTSKPATTGVRPRPMEFYFAPPRYASRSEPWCASSEVRI